MNIIKQLYLLILIGTNIHAATDIYIKNLLTKNTKPFDYIVAYISTSGTCTGHRIPVPAEEERNATVNGCDSIITVVFPDRSEAVTTTSWTGGTYNIGAFGDSYTGYYIKVEQSGTMIRAQKK